LNYTYEMSRVGVFKVSHVKKTSSPVLVFILASRTLLSETELSWGGKVSLQSTTSQWVAISNCLGSSDFLLKFGLADRQPVGHWLHPKHHITNGQVWFLRNLRFVCCY